MSDPHDPEGDRPRIHVLRPELPPQWQVRVAAPPPEPPPQPSFLERARAAPMTFGLAAINVLVFVVLEARTSGVMSTLPRTLLQSGANHRAFVLGGEYWRLATYMFLHVGWLHLIWNIYASIGFCAAVERALGPKRFVLAYLVAGIGGGAASALFSGVTSAGASGALFGIVGAMLALRRRTLPSFAAFFRDPPTRATLVNIAIWTAIGSTALNLDNAAHLGGLASGFAFTWVVTAKKPRFEWVAFGVAFGALLIAATRPGLPLPEKDREMVAAVGEVYLEGLDGFPVDKARGTRFAKRACDAGSAPACALLRSP